MAGPRRRQDLLRDARVERVRQGICESIAPFDLRVGKDQECRAEVRMLDLGLVRIVNVPGGQMTGEVFRTPGLIRRSDPELCKIDLQLHGRAVIEQDDRQAELGTGDFSFVDLSRPCQLAGELNSVAAVMFPRALLPLRYQDTRQLTGVTFGTVDPTSALVTALVGRVLDRGEQYAGPAGARIGTAIFDLITAALSARLDRTDALPADTRLQVLTWRVKNYIEQRLGDHELSPAEVAAAHHISLRYLYRIFEGEQTTVGAWIRGRRLDRCQRDLVDPALNDRPVSAVGSRWGFVDATHFGRVFRSQYGVTPSEYRRICALPTSGGSTG
jgi:AraC-like DNA-binding protein